MASTRPPTGGAAAQHIQMYSQKPLPPIPRSPPVPVRSPARLPLRPNLSVDTNPIPNRKPQKPRGHSRSRSLPTNEPSWKLSKHISSISLTPRATIPAPSATGYRPSRKIHQLTGHDVDVMVQKPAPFNMLDEDLSFEHSLNSRSLDDTYFDTPPLGSSPGDLLPVLEVDEGSSSGRSSWGSSSPMPAPLNLPRHARNLSNDSGVGGLSLDDTYALEPKRWDPAYGQFTDLMAAGEYHRFATELASSSPAGNSPTSAPTVPVIPTTQKATKVPKTPKTPKMPKTPKLSTESIDKKRTSRLRLTGSAAFARLYESTPTPRKIVLPIADVAEEESSGKAVPDDCFELDSTPIEPPKPPPTSAFDDDSDEEDEEPTRTGGRHWWRRNADELNLNLTLNRSKTRSASSSRAEKRK